MEQWSQEKKRENDRIARDFENYIENLMSVKLDKISPASKSVCKGQESDFKVKSGFKFELLQLKMFLSGLYKRKNKHS